MKITELLLVIGLMVMGRSYAQFPSKLSATDKVYGLSKFWQEVNYNFVYLNKIDRQGWDSMYRALIPQVQATKNDYDYWRLMEKFCAFLKDGHTGVWSSDTAISNNFLTKMFGKYWIGFTNVDGHAIVNYTLKKHLKEIPIGSELIEVDGLPTAQYLKERILPYMSSSTDYVREDMAISNIIAELKGSTYHVKLKRPNNREFASDKSRPGQSGQ